MAELTSPRHILARQELFNKFHHIALLRDASLRAAQLHEVGISVSELDLEDAENFPRYFLPLAAEKIASLDERRPEIDPTLTTDEWFLDGSPHDRSQNVAWGVNQARNFEGVKSGESCVMETTRWIHSR